MSWLVSCLGICLCKCLSQKKISRLHHWLEPCNKALQLLAILFSVIQIMASATHRLRYGPCSRVLETHYPGSRPVNTARIHGRSKDALHTSVYGRVHGPWFEMPFGLCTRVGWRKHVLHGVHIGATRRIRLNRLCAAAMRPYVKLLWTCLSVFNIKLLFHQNRNCWASAGCRQLSEHTRCWRTTATNRCDCTSIQIYQATVTFTLKRTQRTANSSESDAK